MSNQINIQKAANGYLVSTPFQPTIMHPDHALRNQARILKEEFQSDPELMRLRHSEPENDQTDDFKITSMPNVFVFKTLDELIGFLKTYL